MNRLADEIVPFGLRIAWRRASWPTSRSPCSVKATTDGVVREPSALGTTVGWPPSTVAITEFVVPRSMPTALAMMVLLVLQTVQMVGLRRAAGEPADRFVGEGLVDEHVEVLGLHASRSRKGSKRISIWFLLVWGCSVPDLARSRPSGAGTSRGRVVDSWVNGRRRRSGELEDDLVDVTPEPALTRLVGTHDRVSRGHEVPRRVASG